LILQAASEAMQTPTATVGRHFIVALPVEY
jgi:hypothetical protein